MGELVVKNGLIVTMDDDRQIYRNGSIRVQDDHIAEIGPAAEVSAATETAETIDATGQIVMPGFVSTHNHLYSAVVRSIPYGGFQTDDFSFIAWMERFWFPMLEDRVTREQMYIGTLANCLGHIRSGITTTADTAEGSYALPGALEDVDRGAMESGIRAVLSFETTGRISEENAQLGLEENVKFFQKAKERGGRVTGRLGVHTTFTCSTELLKQVRAEATRLGSGLMMHMEDDRWHRFDSTRRHGKRPTRYLEDIGFLGPDLILFHCAYIHPIKDPPIFAKHDVKVAHNAESLAIFSFWPDLMPLHQAGVTVAFGTDGQTHSMFEIMRSAQMIHRIRYEDLDMIPDEMALTMATRQGARCLLMEDKIGSLEVGKKADIVLLNNRSTVPVFEANVVNYIVSNCEKQDVDTVIVDGEIVLREGEFVKVDEDRVLAHSREQAIDLWRKNEWPLP